MSATSGTSAHGSLGIRFFRLSAADINCANMLSIGKALFVAAFGFAASELRFKNTTYSPFRQTPANDGDLYQRPNGKCRWNGEDVTGCNCSGTVIVGYYADLALQGVVCTRKCSDGNKCPTPPKGRVECVPGEESLCAMACSSKDDCLEGAYCQLIDGGPFICLALLTLAIAAHAMRVRALRRAITVRRRDTRIIPPKNTNSTLSRASSPQACNNPCLWDVSTGTEYFHGIAVPAASPVSILFACAAWRSSAFVYQSFVATASCRDK
ncbi:hypothetical protein FOL47_000330, partial [Perkinsus chesapeaki]